MITQVLICDLDAIGHPDGSSIWAGEAPRLDYEDVDNALLSTLWRTLNPDESGVSLEGTDLLVWPDASPMVFRLPDDLTDRLSRLASGDIDGVAARWAADADAQLEGLTVEAARKGLLELSDFARCAVAAGSPLVLAMYLP